MNPTVYPIAAGDFALGGSASRRLKDQLKAIGAAPDAVRRAMIAAYEAEMNVVIHSVGGRLEARLDARRLDVEVADDGPGIPDIDQAMREGFSTAPPAARALGFGAGMGLPNIRAASDVFAIESAAGGGTRLRFTIYLKAQQPGGTGRHSIQVAAVKCRQCLRCLRACPTRALRVRAGRREILDHLCIDCTACIAACPVCGLVMAGAAEVLPPADDTVLVVPEAALFQFGPGVPPERVLAALAELGFRDVRRLDAWEETLRAAVAAYAKGNPVPPPIISPVCPAVTNLVATRFPSLLGQLAPYLAPVEAAREDLSSRRAAFVAACPCQRTALESGASKPGIITPAALRAALAPIVARARGQPRRPAAPSRNAPAADSSAALRVTGVRHVLSALEAAENGLLGDVGILELFACDEGCWGSPALSEDPFVARHRGRLAGLEPGPARAAPRKTPVPARTGLRLDADMARAIEKLSKIQALLAGLPGDDCGRCGSPTCAALAEDLVLGRAAGITCIHAAERGGDNYASK